MAKKFLQNTNHDSLPKLADGLVSGTKNLLREAKTEEDLRIGFEKFLEPIKTELNLKSTPKYEKSVYSGRSDAVHGQVIIEYEPPKSFSSRKNIDHVYEQLVNYLTDEAKETKLTQLVGVGFDGEQIFFVQYQDKNGNKIEIFYNYSIKRIMLITKFSILYQSSSITFQTIFPIFWISELKMF